MLGIEKHYAVGKRSAAFGLQEDTMKRLANLLVVPIVLGVSLSVGMASADPVPAPAAPSAYVAPHMTHRSYGNLRVVVPLTSPDKMVQAMKLRNLSNSIQAVEKWGGSLDVRVIIYAKGISLLVNPDDSVRAQLDYLRAHHVKFEICNNSILEQGVDFHTLYGVVDDDIVPSGFAEVAYLQTHMGFVIDPMN
jgi:hypothetical protein